jgi:signal transduction histidine kinase
MQKVSEKIGIDKVSLVKALDFLPYPFLMSEFRDGAQHNIFVNKKFTEEIGYTCQEIPTLGEWFTLAYPNKYYRNEIILDWSERIKAAKEAGEDSVIKQARIQTRNNGLRWYEVKASVYDQVNLVAFININDEITKEEDLQRLNENKDRTLSILSHDLRSPLANLYSILQLLNNHQITKEETEHVLQQLTGQVFKMLEFLDTTLQWSKINFSELQLRPQFVEVNAIVDSVLDIYKAAYSEKRIFIKLNIDAHVPLRCDPDVLSILFRNVFSNAVKYTPEGGSVMISNEARDNRYVLSVENSGQGISQEKIEMILSKSYQSERGTSGEKGLGLGLKLCQQLLETIGGSLEIENKNSTGTIFKIVL